MQTPAHPSEARGAAGEREGEEQGSFSGSPGGEPMCFQLARQHLPDAPLCPLPMAGAEGEGQQDLGDNSWKFCEARGGGGVGRVSEGLDRAAFWGFRGDQQTALSTGYWLGLQTGPGPSLLLSQRREMRNRPSPRRSQPLSGRLLSTTSQPDNIVQEGPDLLAGTPSPWASPYPSLGVLFHRLQNEWVWLN